MGTRDALDLKYNMLFKLQFVYSIKLNRYKIPFLDTADVTSVYNSFCTSLSGSDGVWAEQL